MIDFKTPTRTHNDDGSWDIHLRVYEGEYTKEMYDADDNLLPERGYQRTSNVDGTAALLFDDVLHFSAMSEEAVMNLVHAKFITYETVDRQPIPEQING